MDISIKNLKSYVFEPKTPALKLSRAKDVTSHDLVATEKVDGTKLTLVRTNLKDKDFEKNWVVAYKGAVLHASEFSHLTDKDKQDISTKSVGIGQYSLIFDHLKNLNHNISSIPTNHEFSIEFAQNKDTLTRTYIQKGGMYLRSFAKVEYRVLNDHLFTTVVGSEITDQTKLETMAKTLSVSAFPVFYHGKINNHDLKANSPVVWQHMEASGVNWSDPLSVIEKFSETMLAIPSTLGGQTEGVVFKLDDGRFFKVVQNDQYDKDFRDQKKGEFRMDPEKTSAYFQQIRKILNGIIAKVSVAGNPAKTMAAVNQVVARLPDTSLPKHDKKTPLQIRDDIHETLRLLISKGHLLGGSDTKSIGLIPIAGKPLHLGHWKLIEKAAKENNVVVVYTSDKDRVKSGEFPIYGKDFVKFWTDIFIPNLQKNVKVKIVDSPFRAVIHELGWYEQTSTQDLAEPPTINIYSDQKDAEENFPSSELVKFSTLTQKGKIHVVGVDRNSTVNISGTKMREFLLQGDKDSFIRNLPPVPTKDKETIWNTLMKNKPENSMKEFVNELIEKTFRDMLSESGASTAMVDPKTPKTVNGEEARASQKLSIVDKRGRDIHGAVSDDIKLLVTTLNHKVGFWKKDNPYIHNGHIFNGSSQFLMDPEKRGELVGVKNTFGDVDVIVPKKFVPTNRGDDGILTKFLDSIDDDQPVWKKTPKNAITTAFQYVGRTKSFASIPDQLVTLWYYQPAGHVVQIDFEGDEMATDAQGFEKPSEWTKFSKDSPWDDLKVGIKGLAGALMLRSLARGATMIPNAVVLTPASAVKVASGALVDITDKNIQKQGGVPVIPTKYTLNTGGGGAGIRPAYKFVKKVNYNGKQVDGYRFVEAKETQPEERITDVGKIFEMIFGRVPSTEEKAQFRSFQGQLQMMKKYLKKPVIDLTMKRFVDNLASEPLSPKEHGAIANATKNILGVSI